MPTDAKLEVYQVSLKTKDGHRNTFESLFNEFPKRGGQPENRFLDFFTGFIKELDGNRFFNPKRTKKAITAFGTKEANSPIRPHTSKYIIDGVFDGGRHGRPRRRAKHDDKTSSDTLDDRDVVTSPYYFFLHTRPNSNVGVLMVQSYSDEGYSDLFKEFIITLCSKGQYFDKPKIVRFCPKSIREEFANYSNVQEIEFGDRFAGAELGDTELDHEVKVRIRLSISGGVPKTAITKFIESVGQKFYGSKTLSDYRERKGTLKNMKTKKTTSFSIESQLDILPTIYLNDRIDTTLDGVPKLISIREYCMNLFENEIRSEIYPGDDIQRI